MQKNESNLDRSLRAILGVVFLALGALSFSGITSGMLFVLGVVMLITAATGFCALYKLFGIDTIGEKK
ncbi:MAG: DUF2892 domain-containing protein [Parcubacteria group bacterium]